MAKWIPFIVANGVAFVWPRWHLLWLWVNFFFQFWFCEVQPTLVVFSTHCLSSCNDYSLRLYKTWITIFNTFIYYIHILCRFDCNSISNLVRNSLTDTFLFHVFLYLELFISVFLINASYSVITTMSTFFCLYLKQHTSGHSFSRNKNKKNMWNDSKRSNKMLWNVFSKLMNCHDDHMTTVLVHRKYSCKCIHLISFSISQTKTRDTHSTVNNAKFSTKTQQ